MEAVKRAKERGVTIGVTAATTVGEETSMRGAAWAAASHAWDLAIAVDVTYVSDCPGTNPADTGDVRLGGGPVLCTATTVNKQANRLLCATAEELGMPIQWEVASGHTGTDADRAHVSGKGIPAAMFMMTAKTMIKDYALTRTNTSEIFTEVNERLCENNEAGMFATAWIGILDLKTRILQFTNAGHNFPIIQKKGMPCEALEKKHGLFLAGMEGVVYRQDEMQLNPGDRILLYTDGVTESHNPKKELFGEERLMNILNRTDGEKGETVLSGILNEVKTFEAGVEQFDDITMSILTLK